MAQLLCKTPVSELLSGKRRLIHVRADASLQDALRLLKENKFLALPVSVKPDNKWIESKPKLLSPPSSDIKAYLSGIRFIGIISNIDIVIFLSKQKKEGKLSKDDVKKILQIPVEEVMGKSHESKRMLVLDPHCLLIRAMAVLGTGKFHRLLVPNYCTQIHEDYREEDVSLPYMSADVVGGEKLGVEYRLLTQLDVLSFLLKHEGQLGLGLAKSLDELGLVWPCIVTVNKSSLIFEALDIINKNQVSGLAVVEYLNETNKEIDFPNNRVLVGTLSASDFVDFDESALQNLNTVTVGEFIKGQKKQITCARGTTLRAAIQRVVEERVHRLWVVEEIQGRVFLEGVVSLTDIIRSVYTLPIVAEFGESVSEPAHEEWVEKVFREVDEFCWLDWWQTETLRGDKD